MSCPRTGVPSRGGPRRRHGAAPPAPREAAAGRPRGAPGGAAPPKPPGLFRSGAAAADAAAGDGSPWIPLQRPERARPSPTIEQLGRGGQPVHAERTQKALGSLLGGLPQKVEPAALLRLLGAEAACALSGGPPDRPAGCAAELDRLLRWADHLASWADHLAADWAASQGPRGPPPGLAKPGLADGRHVASGTAGCTAGCPNGWGDALCQSPGADGCARAARPGPQGVPDGRAPRLGAPRAVAEDEDPVEEAPPAAGSPGGGQQRARTRQEETTVPGHADEGHEDGNEQEEAYTDTQNGDDNLSKDGDGSPGRSGTMGHHLQVLEAQDVQCVFVVRRINTLALSSPEILASHYSAFGPVKEVLVPHSRVKARFSRQAAGHLRTRPGSIGFVIMADANTVEAVLQAGREQTVAGKRIIVEPFMSALTKPNKQFPTLSSEPMPAVQP